METKGVKDKKNICNPVKQAEKAAKAAAEKQAALDANEAAAAAVAAEKGEWIDHPYKRKQRKIVILLNNFVTKCFNHFGLDEHKDLISKNKIRILFMDGLWKYYTIDESWDQ